MLYAGLGAAAMGIWTAMMVPASSLLNRERWQGTLELVVAAPTRFSLVILPITLAMATIGLYSVVATIVWDRLTSSGSTCRSSRGRSSSLGVLLSALTIAEIGFLLSVTAVRYRTSWALGAALEYPGWLLCGFVVPLELLPDVLRPFSYALPTTWAVEAMRAAAVGGAPWRELGLCLAVGTAYAVLAAVLGVRLIDSARRNATLALDLTVSLRIFFVGGLMSYRAQFNWLNPWILIPSLLVTPVAQILLFAYIGRAADVGNDEFYVIGNALNYAAIPCLFAMRSRHRRRTLRADPRDRLRHASAPAPALPGPVAAGDPQRLGGRDVRHRHRPLAARRRHPRRRLARGSR